MKLKYLIAIASLFSLSANAANWKMALGDAGGSTQEVLGQKFAEIVTEKTNGDIEIQLFPNGQLGSEQATVNDIALGTLDLSILGSNNLAPFSPSMNILAFPYIFESVDEAKKILEGDIGKILSEDSIKNANSRILAWTYSGYRRLSNSKHPVTTIEDIKDLVIRVPKSETLIKTYNAIDVNPTPMAWSETFTALQQGVVDGQETPYAAIHAMKFGEIQKYITETKYVFQLEPLIISESLFQDQTEEVQAILLDAGNQASEHTLNWLNEKESEIKQGLIDEYGVEISQLEDEQQWASLAREKIWPELIESIDGQELVDMVNEQLGR